MGLALFGLFLLAPTLLIELYLWALLYQVVVRLIVVRENAGYWATFKVYAYTSVVGLVSWVPGLGLPALLFCAYLTFVGVRKTHSASPGRAAAVALVAFLFLGGSYFAGLPSHPLGA